MLKKLLKNESGQASIEYVLMLLVSAGFAIILLTKLIQPAFRVLVTATTNALNQRLFGADFHSFRMP